jgi:tetratricopeptide (TPR) repeat protein
VGPIGVEAEKWNLMVDAVLREDTGDDRFADASLLTVDEMQPCGQCAMPCMKHSGLREAEILTRRLPDEHVAVLHARHAAAQMLVRAGRGDEAREMLDPLLAAAPEGAEALRMRLAGVLVLAELERLEARGESALALAEEVLSDPASAAEPALVHGARWQRAYALAALGERAEAEAERERALACQAPDAPSAPYYDARFAAVAGEPERALAENFQKRKLGWTYC